jgi:hypothetical protein
MSRITHSVVAIAPARLSWRGEQPKELGSSSNAIRSRVVLYPYGEAITDNRISAAFAFL